MCYRLKPVTGSMINRLDDPQHWRDRAEGARQIARLVTDHRAKEAILQMAQEYDQLARDAEQRVQRSRNSN